MSMVINLVEDHNIYLCEGGPVYNGGVQPTPITYLTQWKIVGNSQVHTDPYLTSWKVSGNSVVDNNTILSCGDLGQDGKYHVKISNGVTIFDIPLTEPLRKVNDVADTIEFPSGTEGKALVMRSLKSVDMGTIEWYMYNSSKAQSDGIYCIYGLLTDGKQFSTDDNISVQNILTPQYRCVPFNTTYVISSNNDKKISVGTYGNNKNAIRIQDSDYNQSDSAVAFATAIRGVELIYELATPTTELIDVSPFPVSPTDTYTSANVVLFSAFEHTENKEIWSCGEYSAVDGKYHILVQPQGGSIADIALTEPLRKVNAVADSIELPSDTDGKALVTRNFASVDMGSLTWDMVEISSSGYFRFRTQDIRTTAKGAPNNQSAPNALIAIYDVISSDEVYYKNTGFTISSNGIILGYDPDYNQSDSAAAFKTHVTGVELIYELATPTTELVDAPQIEEADSYTCVISQDAKAVSWSSFTTE